MSSAVVTEAGPAELDAVMAVMEAAFDPAHGEAWTRAQIAGVVGMPGTVLLLARMGEAPVGFALARTVLDEAELLLLAVCPGARRRGHGSALIREIAARVQCAGAGRLHLEMREGNPAHPLYTRLGFRELGRRRGYYRQADGGLTDALTLSKRLIA